MGDDNAVDGDFGLVAEERHRHVMGCARGQGRLQHFVLRVSQPLTDRHPVAGDGHLDLAGVAGQRPQPAEATRSRDREAADPQVGPIPAPGGRAGRVEVGAPPAVGAKVEPQLGALEDAGSEGSAAVVEPQRRGREGTSAGGAGGQRGRHQVEELIGRCGGADIDAAQHPGLGVCGRRGDRRGTVDQAGGEQVVDDAGGAGRGRRVVGRRRRRRERVREHLRLREALPDEVGLRAGEVGPDPGRELVEGLEAVVGRQPQPVDQRRRRARP